MIILHARCNEGFVPNARTIHFITYKTYFLIHQYCTCNKIARKKNKSEVRLELTILRVQKSILTTEPMRKISIEYSF